MNGEEIKDLVIPNSVTRIGEYAFHNCSGLTSVTIGNSVTSIGRCAFECCSGLTSVTIGNSVTSIGNYAFCGCSSLTSVTIPNSVTSIGDNAFLNCTSLTSVTIGNNVTSIGRWAFDGCSGLTSVTIISNRATSIGCYSFNGCSRLNIIILGSSVRSLGSSTSATTGHTFANCPELTDVWCYAEKVPSAYSNDFEGSYIEYATLHVPEESIELYKAKAPWSKFGTILAIEEEFSEEQQLFLAQYDELLAAAKDKLNTFKQKQQEEQTGKLISNASQLISPYTESSEGSLANLLDENTSTFWHSSWRGGAVENGIHYLQVDLINPVNVDIYLTFTRRNISSDQVTNMSVLGTNDADAAKTDCKELLTFGCPYNSSTETITSPQFNTKGYRHLRIYANATNSNRGYWHMAEFQLYRVTPPSESLADYLDGEDERLQDIIDRLAGLGRNQIGQDEYDALKEAYDAFMAKLADAADGIGSLKDSKDLKVSWHSLDGRRLPAPQKGVNIIRYPDGSTKKVLMK